MVPRRAMSTDSNCANARCTGGPNWTSYGNGCSMLPEARADPFHELWARTNLSGKAQGPWRHPKQQHLAQRPDMVGQRRRHRRRLELPLLGRARPFGQLRLRQGLAQGGMRQAEIVVDVIQRQLLV